MILSPNSKRLLALAVLLGCAGTASTVATSQGRHGTAALLTRAKHRLANLRHHPDPSASHPHRVAGPQRSATTTAGASDQRMAGRPATALATPLTAVRADGFVALDSSVTQTGSAASASLERATFPTSLSDGVKVSTALGSEFANAHQAIALYRKGAIADGDQFANTVTNRLLRVALEWVAIRFDPRETGLPRLQAFVAAHPDWAMRPWLERRMEELSLSAAHDPDTVLARFAGTKPLTLYGRLALARADLAASNPLEAAVIVRDIWRTKDIDEDEETSILKEFGPLIARDDHKFRADRLLYKEQVPAALRAAALAGPDVKLLALARASVINKAGTRAIDSAFAAVPKNLAGDPGLVFSRIQKARRADRIGEAADLMASATQDPALLVNGDEWWTERRLIARKLLDTGDARRAYALCAGHGAASDASVLEAEFHAGWLALRFLNDPKTALVHFGRLAGTAGTPISRARAAYWQGRAAEAAGDKDAANHFYAAAAEQRISFYGQLAADRLGRGPVDLRQPAEAAAVGDDRREAVRVVEQLYGLGERDIALPLALEIAKTEKSDAQLGALAAILTDTNDAKTTLLVGKLATQRGLALDETAFPTFGIPGYLPLTNSADRAVVYAIARQESEFDPKSVSAAGAKGLMQLITSTARQTATKSGIGFNDQRLLTDAAYNAQIGAAHLGQLLSEQQGSYILTFAAYNAGSGRVKEWIGAYGDPRKPGIDPIDWIERIPFAETRNYVQRVYENLQIYRSRFGQPPAALVGAQLAQNGKRT